MGGSADFVDLEDGGFVVIALRNFPGASAEEVGVVVGSVVVAPVADVFDRSRAGDRGFEARAWCNYQVGLVPAVTVAADGEVIGIGDAVFHQGVDAFENIFAGTRDDDRNNLQEKLVAVSGGTAVVGAEHEPSISGGERGPLVPVGGEGIAIGVS